MHTLTHGGSPAVHLPLLLPAAPWYLHRSGLMAGMGSHASCLFSGAHGSVGTWLCCACQRSGWCRVSLLGAHQVLTTVVFTSWSPPPLQIEILLLHFLSSLFLFCFNSWCSSFVTIYSGLWSSTSLTLWVLGWFCVFDPDMLFTATCLS